MNKSLIEKYLNLKDEKTLGEYKILKSKFVIKSYDVPNFGCVAFLNNKNEDNMILAICPKYIDAPLLAISLIKGVLNTKLTIELFNTYVLGMFDSSALKEIIDKNKHLSDLEIKPHSIDALRNGASMYKSCKYDEATTIIEKYLKTYFDLVKYTAPCALNIKQDKLNAFFDDAINNGGYIINSLKEENSQELVDELVTKLFK